MPSAKYTPKSTPVERPAGPNGNQPAPLTVAILATADTGQALTLHVNGYERRKLVDSLGHRVRNRGLAFRYRTQGDAVIVWAERKPETKPETPAP